MVVRGREIELEGGFQRIQIRSENDPGRDPDRITSKGEIKFIINWEVTHVLVPYSTRFFLTKSRHTVKVKAMGKT